MPKTEQAPALLSPEEIESMKALFKAGYEAADQDPAAYWFAKQQREDQTPPGPGLETLIPSPWAQPGQELRKSGGPYIGPMGGLWADPQHTQHWTPEAHGGLHGLAQKFGGKVVEHGMDSTKLMVKVAPKHKPVLDALRQQHGIADEVFVGGKYAMLPVPKALAGAPTAPPPAAAKPAPPPAPPKPEVKAPPKAAPKSGIPAYAGHPSWKPHASLDEAKAWAAERGIDVGYTDVATANQTNAALAEQHPMVLQHIEFMGTASQLHEWAKAHPDIVKRAMTEAKHKADLRTFSLGGSAIAIAHPTTAKPYTQSVVAVADGWGTAAKYDAKAKGFSSGFTRGNTLADTLRHECGHVEGFIFRHLYPDGPGQPSAWEIWKKAAAGALKADSPGVMKDISEYGATNPHECWAEVSVMRRTGAPLPKWAQVAIEKMKIDKVPWESMAAKSLAGKSGGGPSSGPSYAKVKELPKLQSEFTIPMDALALDLDVSLDHAKDWSEKGVQYVTGAVSIPGEFFDSLKNDPARDELEAEMLRQIEARVGKDASWSEGEWGEGLHGERTRYFRTKRKKELPT